MSNLSDFSELREKIIENAITPGQILYIYSPIINPPKEKYIILLSVEPRIRYVFINSEKTEYMKGKSELNFTHVETRKSEYTNSGFQKDVSLANCYDIKSNLTYDGLKLELQNIDRIKDKINDQTKKEILIAIDNDNVSEKIQEEIKNSLK